MCRDLSICARAEGAGPGGCVRRELAGNTTGMTPDPSTDVEPTNVDDLGHNADDEREAPQHPAETGESDTEQHGQDNSSG